MKLIPLIVFAISLAVDCRAYEHFAFPPQFSTPHPMFSPEKAPYLSPEPHTPIAYHPMKNINLPFPYLPLSNTRSPVPFPSPRPNIISSTYRPINDDDENDDENYKSSAPFPPFFQNRLNHTEGHQNQRMDRKELRPIPKSFQLPIDRIDTKIPLQFSTKSEPSTQNEKMISSRSIVISDLQRKDSPFDQVKASNFQAVQYIPQPGIFVSSTTETSVPILRLSNEMDLDGSFSYEALGADQTHYVQHSRMENMGSGKEEQVVEGSYSYVGDNGKTYTVHYIADSNGFRAIGDHLPVAPPVPEIIQRSIQYNLVEEAKKPPSFKSWNEEQSENEVNESEKQNQFALSQPRINNLFTGKTPESFSHSFPKASNVQHNLVAAASTQSPMVATIDFKPDQIQSQQNSGTISPQITFLASQGAHVPSPNTPQQTITRMFTSEKSTLPQLINYEASMKEPDQESNKALWRWQYGQNANSNQNIDKTSISRSFGEDDVTINFGDMTQEQYTKMLNQDFDQNTPKNIEAIQHIEDYDQHQYINSKTPSNFNNNHLNREMRHSVSTEPNQFSTEITTTLTHSTAWPKELSESSKPYVPNINDITSSMQRHIINEESRPLLITQQKFIPRSQMVTQMYDYDDHELQSRKSTIMTSEKENANDINLIVVPLNNGKSSQDEFRLQTQPKNISNTITTQNPPIISTTNGNIKFSDFIVRENKDDFKPLFADHEKEETTTTENSLENLFTENVFIKNMLTSNKNKQDYRNNIQNENKYQLVKPIDTRIDKRPKSDHQPKSYKEIKHIIEKPTDVSALLNFMNKIQFESNKINSKPKLILENHTNEDYYYGPEDDEKFHEEQDNTNFRTIQQQEELRGVIKNYKVLQRNHNMDRAKIDNINMDRFRNKVGSHSAKTYNLPPLGRAGPSAKSYLSPVYV